MFGDAKYIVIREDGDFGEEENIYPFSKHIMHVDFARKIGGASGPSNVLGAGFIVFNDNEPKCYGESVSLRVSSRPIDTLMAKKAFFGD